MTTTEAQLETLVSKGCARCRQHHVTRMHMEGLVLSDDASSSNVISSQRMSDFR